VPSEEEYWGVLEAAICRKCVDGAGSGACLISRGTCALKTHLPQILDVVTSTYSTSIDEYEARLRSAVCSHCTEQSRDGTCVLRDTVECALDRYFSLIVQVVEETRMRGRAQEKL